MKQIQRFFLFSILIVFIIGIPLSAYAINIQNILIHGNVLIPDNTILLQIDSKVGLPYNPKIVTQDIQKIYNLGFFSSIEVDAEEVDGGVQLTFILEERPFVTNIKFEGNKKLKDDKLKEVLTLNPEDLSDPFKLKFYPLKIKEDVENLKQLYHEKGFHNARIVADLLPDSSDPKGKLTLKYTIQENVKASVKKINFNGNTAFSKKQLRKTMQTKEKWFFSFITGAGKYEKDAFETDLERLRFFYIDHGYIDAKISDYSLDFQNEKGDLYITITLDEGEIYRIDEVNITGNTVYSTEEIQKVISLSPNDPFSRTTIWKDKVEIADLYARKGYLTPISEKTEGKLLIDPEFSVDRENRHVSVTYSLREGVPHFLNRLTIAGNHTTRDKVIRREVKLREGELFDSTLVEQSQKKVMNLGYFDTVQYEVSETSKANTVDLEFEVEERSVGSFFLGGGWGSADSWTVSGGVTTSNLFGLGHEIDFSAELGAKSQTFNLSYNVPRFLDSPYKVGIYGFNTKKERTTYDYKRTGGGLSFGRRITDNIFGSMKYLYERVKFTNIDKDASTYIKEQEGESRTSSVSLYLKRSTLNNVILPTKGMVTELRGEIAGGILQGDNDFYKVTAEQNLYIPLFKDVALRLRGEYAYAQEYGRSDEVPFIERFFGGGIDRIRGYEDDSIGPKDENDEPLGGTQRIVLTSEIIIPVQKQIRLLTFFDMGDVYASEESIDISTFKKSIGVGGRLFTPFGLLKLDWGYKLEKEEGESDYEFHFGLGGMF